MGRGGQHAHATLEETIYTIGIDTFPQIAKLVVERVRSHQTARKLPEWLQLQLGTDDLPDAFRGCPLHASQQHAAAIAIWSPVKRGWAFGVMNGCPFGLGSVVVTINCYPTLVTAMLRRNCRLFAGAYFDDNL